MGDVWHKKWLAENLHDNSRWGALPGFIRYLLQRFLAAKCTQTAASLTFTTLLALIPLLTITLMVFSTFPVFSEYSVRFKAFIMANLVPDAAGRIISVYLQQFSDNAGRLTALGLGGLAITAVMLIYTIETTFNAIWGVPNRRKLLNRAVIYWTLITLGPLLLGATLSVTSEIFARHGLLGSLPVMGGFFSQLGSVALVSLALSLLYIIVPNCYVPPKHAVIAAIIVACLLELMRLLFSIYIRRFSSYTLVYGAFASFPILLLWLYMSWSLVLSGAILSTTLSYWNKGAWRLQAKTRTELEGALAVLLHLARIYETGKTAKTRRLYRELGMGSDQIQHILRQLAKHNLVKITGDGGWILARPLETISLRTLFGVFVYQYPHNAHHPLLHDIYRQLAEVLEVDLRTLKDRV